MAKSLPMLLTSTSRSLISGLMPPQYTAVTMRDSEMSQENTPAAAVRRSREASPLVPDMLTDSCDMRTRASRVYLRINPNPCPSLQPTVVQSHACAHTISHGQRSRTYPGHLNHAELRAPTASGLARNGTRIVGTGELGILPCMAACIQPSASSAGCASWQSLVCNILTQGRRSSCQQSQGRSHH